MLSRAFAFDQPERGAKRASTRTGLESNDDTSTQQGGAGQETYPSHSASAQVQARRRRRGSSARPARSLRRSPIPPCDLSRILLRCELSNGSAWACGPRVSTPAKLSDSCRNLRRACRRHTPGRSSGPMRGRGPRRRCRRAKGAPQTPQNGPLGGLDMEALPGRSPKMRQIGSLKIKIWAISGQHATGTATKIERVY